MTTQPDGNGTPLPASRQAAVEQGLAFYQEVAAERDEIAAERDRLKVALTGAKVAMEVQAAQITEMESRVQSATLMRDQAVADRAVFETLFISVQAQMRAFKIPGAPLVRARAETEPDEPTIGGA